MKIQEFDIINRYFKPLATDLKTSLNLEDDAAKITIKNDEELVVSKDMIAQDVHFNFEDGARNIASKLILSNLSDIAACGAVAKYYLLGFCLNEKIDEKFCQEFCDELKKIQDKFKISLIGGDTISSKKGLFFSITIFGIIKKNKFLSRKMAKNQDLIFTTGTIGDSFLGYKFKNDARISKKDQEYFLKRHFQPSIHLDFANQLVKNNLSKCAIDVSDGLLADLKHICKASKLSANIFLDKIPISDIAKKYVDKNLFSIQDLISGGEDYELIFTINKKDEKKLLSLAKKFNVCLNKIGFMEKSLKFEVNLFDKNNKIKIEKYGYEH